MNVISHKRLIFIAIFALVGGTLGAISVLMNMPYLAFLNPIAGITGLFIESNSEFLFKLQFTITSIFTYGLLGFLFTSERKKIYIPIVFIIFISALIFLLYLVTGIAD